MILSKQIFLSIQPSNFKHVFFGTACRVERDWWCSLVGLALDSVFGGTSFVSHEQPVMNYSGSCGCGLSSAFVGSLVNFAV